MKLEELQVVKEIDYKKRNWRRDISLHVATLSMSLILVLIWYADIRSASIPILFLSLVSLGMHELMHGALFKVWTGKVKFGAGLTKFGPVLYATSVGSILSRNKMIIIALAPQLLTVLYFVGASLLPVGDLRSLLAISGTFNLGGGVGDFYVTIQMLKYPKELQVEDLPGGMKFYIPGSEGLSSLPEPNIIK